MSNTTSTEAAFKPVAAQLNTLLANYHIHYQKLRGCHWNVKGASFFTLHLKFEELYTQALLNIDELAERILTLETAPYSTFTDYLQHASIKEINTIGLKDTDMVIALINDMNVLIELERQLMTYCAQVGDDGTNDMLNRFMQFKEKTVWMLKAFVNQ